MTIKLTKRMTAPERAVYIGKCIHCKSEYTAFRGDITFKSDGRNGQYSTEECSVCNNGTIDFFPQPPKKP